jgi:hypothetical protein
VRINLPSQLRVAIYVFASLGSLVVTYLVAKKVLGSDEVSLWTGFVAIVTGMAGLNTASPDK